MRVLIPAAQKFLRPKNTDWRYAAKTLPSLSRYFPDSSICVQSNWLAEAEVNLRYGLTIARSRGFGMLPKSWGYSLTQDCPLSAADVEKAGANCILSYERYPAKSFGLPVAWIASPTYAEILAQLGMDRAYYDREIEWKRSRAEKAAQLIFTTQLSLNNFVKQSSESFRSKSVVIPFLIEGLKPIEDITPKWNSDELRILFVGREAHRKGLPVMLEAAIPVLRENPNVSFTIVSRMDDGAVEVPDLPNLKVLRETDRSEVLKLMAESHILAMPSSWESYGFVYVEAMSQGCIPLATNLPVQRELIGQNGILVMRDAAEIQAALEDVLRNREKYYRKALSGLAEFKAKHSAERVAAQFYSALARSCEYAYAAAA